MADESAAADLEALRRRLAEAEETLRAIRGGEVDALVVEGPDGPRVYTLRSAEEPYRELVERMNEGAATLTPEGDILYCNHRLAELAGAPMERVIGESVLRFIRPADRPTVIGMLAAGRGRCEAHVQGADGRRTPVYLSVNRLVCESVESLCLIVTDLAELVRTRAERSEAEAANRMKDEFIAMLGHELRNPLGAISSAASVLLQLSEHDDMAARACDVIHRQTEHLTRMIEDLLDLTRAKTGKIGLTPVPLDVAEVTQHCLRALGSTGKLDQHALKVEASSVWVNADPTRLEQIVSNLISNAVKFTPAGGTVWVTVAGEGAHAVLRVADTGVGISADLLPRVFDLFVQGERGLDRASGGLGIGLSLVRRLAELHEGRVEADSAGPGEGSVFTVRLPALDSSTVPRPSDAKPAAVDTPRRCIVLIEDDEDSREMLRVSLEMAGHEIGVAADGPGGLDLVQRRRPDVVLIDVGLPGMDGYEVARRIRTTPEGGRMRLIALTGYGQQEDRRRSRESGFDAHLVKPIDPACLMSALSSSDDVGLAR
jgi:two-component system, sensor histidine kinase